MVLYHTAVQPVTVALFATSQLEIHVKKHACQQDDRCINKLNIYKCIHSCPILPVCLAVFQLYFIHENTVIEY